MYSAARAYCVCSHARPLLLRVSRGSATSFNQQGSRKHRACVQSTQRLWRSLSIDARRCAAELHICRSVNSAAVHGGRMVVEGDVVTVHFECITQDGQVLESTHQTEEPLTFEVGVSETVGNPLYQAIDSAVRGLCVGDKTAIEAQGGPWRQDLVFDVPIEHEEIQRLEGRYKSQGGVQEGNIVELSNGRTALVVRKSEEGVTLDTNSMFAGRSLTFELEVVRIDDAPAPPTEA